METFSALLVICAGNSPVSGEFPHKGQWRGALMFSLICVLIKGWVNNCPAGDLRRYRAHYDVTVMTWFVGAPILLHCDVRIETSKFVVSIDLSVDTCHVHSRQFETEKNLNIINRTLCSISTCMWDWKSAVSQLALGKSLDCPSVSEVTFRDTGKTGSNNQRLNTAKHRGCAYFLFICFIFVYLFIFCAVRLSSSNDIQICCSICSPEVTTFDPRYPYQLSFFLFLILASVNPVAVFTWLWARKFRAGRAVLGRNRCLGIWKQFYKDVQTF